MIDVLGKPMIQRVIDNVNPGAKKIIVITRAEHNISLPDEYLNLSLNYKTEGAVATLMAAKPVFDELGDVPILIANSDQLVDFDVEDFVDTDLDGRLVTFLSNKPHHSYVKTVGDVITEIVEKEVISNQAVTGVYYFKSSQAFFKAAHEVIRSNDKTKGEFYVSTVITKLVKGGKHLGVYEAPSTMLGTPAELQHFLVAARMAKTL
jgi:NDP-sugar pyrophosphorylase family protein